MQLGFDSIQPTAAQNCYGPRHKRLRPAAPHRLRPDPTKSISGAPDGGSSNGHARKSDKPVGRREAIQDAIRRVNGGL